MLATLKTMEVEFHSVEAALDYLSGRVVQRFTVPVHDLTVTAQGRLTHAGAVPIADLRDLPLTDTAMAHLNSLAGIPAHYAAQIDAELHAHSLNELLQKRIAAVTVIVEVEKQEPDKRNVEALLPGSRLGVDDTLILQRIAARQLSAAVRLHSGQLDVHVGDGTALEVLPGDEVRISAELRNERWGTTSAAARPMLEVGLYLLRLVCANGAYAQRALAESRLMAWATRKEIDVFLDREIERVLTFQPRMLSDAVSMMSETMPTDEERAKFATVIRRFMGKKRAEELLADDVVSWWDAFNLATAAAKEITNASRRRRLQIAAGEYLERFIA